MRINTQLSDRSHTGQAPMHGGVWVGDFPPSGLEKQLSPTVVPLPYIQPAPQYPSVNSGFSLILGDNNVPWRTTYTTDGVKASIDMPGVKVEDLTLDLENGTLVASARRFDDRRYVSYKYTIGSDFDPKTAEATLESGVLTVTMQRFKEKRAHRIPVTAK